MIVQLKEVGFSLEEINNLTAIDFIDVMDAYIKANDPNQENVRMATQEDMNRFTGYKVNRAIS